MSILRLELWCGNRRELAGFDPIIGGGGRYRKPRFGEVFRRRALTPAATIGKAGNGAKSLHEQAVRPMTLRLFNTLSGQMDELVPADGEALRMYACGPTVYAYGQIGR